MAKGKGKGNHKGARTPGIETILEYLKILEKNQGNYSAAAKEIGIYRTTLKKYDETYGAVMKHRKLLMKDHLVDQKRKKEQRRVMAMEKIRVEMPQQIMNQVASLLTVSLNKAVGLINQRIEAGEMSDMSNRDLVSYIQVIAPLVAKPEDESAKNNQTSFVQTIINQINNTKIDVHNEETKHSLQEHK